MSKPQTKRQPIAVQVLKHALQRAQATALQQVGSTLSYRSLALRAISYAERFKSLEDSKHSIAVCLSDPFDLIAVFLGARLCGHNVLVLNPAWPVQAQQQCLEQLQPALSITEDDLLHTPIETDDDTDASTARIEQWIERADRDLNSAFYTGFTSGSEGSPKGFSRHENSWLHSFETDHDSYKLSADDCIICPGKLAHSLFLYASMRALSAGLPVCFLEGLAHSAQRQQLAQYRSAVLFAVPAQLQSLLDQPEPQRNIRLVVSAGAKLQPSLRQQLALSLPKAEIIECYGSSELSYIALSLPAHKPPEGSVGKACDGVQIKIVDTEGQPQPPNTSGRLLVQSELQFIGYAEANNTTSLRNLRRQDGYIDSGDTGYLDEHGFLYITGRSDRMMLIAGHSVFPEEVEAALLSHRNVHSVAVFPIDDTRRGQRPVAVIEAIGNGTVTRKSLMAHAAKTLNNAAIPRHYYRAAPWPRTVSDKTDIKQLQQRYERQQLEPLL